MAEPRAQIARLFVEHLPDVVRTLLRFGVSRSEVDDAAGKVFFVAYKHLCSGGSPIEDPGAWLYKIARKTASTIRRSLQNRLEHVPFDEAIHLDTTSDTESIASRRELLYRLFQEVKEADLSVFIARHLDKRKWQEVAAMHEISISAAKKRCQAAVDAIQAALRRWQLGEERRETLVLPVALASLLDADRSPVEVSESLRRGALNALSRRIRSYEMGSPSIPRSRSALPDSTRPVVRVVRAQPLGIGRILALFLFGAAVGGIIVYLLMRAQPQPGPAPATPVRAPLVATVIPAGVKGLADVPEPSTATLAPVPAQDDSGPHARAITKERSAVDRAEGELIDQAIAAIGRRDPHAALAALFLHRQRFPQGQLKSIRETQISQLCAMPALHNEDECIGPSSASVRGGRSTW